MDIREILGKDGLISSNYPDFEIREPQIKMAEKISEVIKENKNLLVEAGTGVGKSWAYLIPIILANFDEGKKGIISTFTRTLQHQLVEKDLPFLKKSLSLPFEYAIFMGGENYLCLRRWMRSHLFISPGERKKLEEWIEKTQTGLFTELPFFISQETLEDIRREGELCAGKDCPYYSSCFYNKARKKIYRADIVVTNHHLLLAHLESGGFILPAVEILVIDEAHNFPEVASSFFTVELSNIGLRRFLQKLYNPRTGKGNLKRWGAPENIFLLLDEVKSIERKFFQKILREYGEEEGRKRLGEIEDTLSPGLKELREALEEVKNSLEDEEEKWEVEGAIHRLQRYEEILLFFRERLVEDYIYCVEISPRRRYILIKLEAFPIEVSSILREVLFPRYSPIILTSATLSLSGDFEYFKQEMGWEEGEEISLGSPFNFKEQVLLYLEKDLPDPREEEEYVEGIVDRLFRILPSVKGGTFVLFTSFRMMSLVYERLKPKFPQMLIQGEQGKERLLERFEEEEKGILFGATTFWQGVDMPGEKLQCVVITRLPFPVPDDPLTEAKSRILGDKGKDPFWEYYLPRASLMLKQGFGRLIRRKEDKGVVAILDPRILKKSYGRFFLKNLPSSRITTELDEVIDFLSRL